ncbi:hypothetical protein [Streptomyces sp. NPDC046261]|uniref:hypothetical protein n=1 Tax=Streptomyces sp. NPDC046261 TaxID=3157200 RepID=UPI003405387D
MAVHCDGIILNATDVKRGIRGTKDEPEIEARFKEFGICNAVIVTRTRQEYTVLVTPDSTRDWDIPWVECVGAGHRRKHLAVPHPTREAWPGAYWLLTAPDCREKLNDPANVRKLLRAGARP